VNQDLRKRGKGRGGKGEEKRRRKKRGGKVLVSYSA
jgi:hypothetical protein